MKSLKIILQEKQISISADNGIGANNWIIHASFSS